MASDSYGSIPSFEQQQQQQLQHSKSQSQSNSTHETLKTIAGVAGNVLELYDFAVFGYFSDVLAQVFFPPDQPGHAALIESFAVFGGAFLMRPIGGILMGHLGDVHGRKYALEVSIFLMAFPTFFMGCLPTYSQVGAWSYILLIVIRLLQGLSVGGQLMSSLVFTLESKPKRHWGFYGSCVMATANFGTLLGGVVAFLIRRHLTEEQVLSYGWRLPFLSGILVGFCGLYLKYYCPSTTEEETVFQDGHPGHSHHDDFSNRSSKRSNKSPLAIAFLPENRRLLLAACFIPILWSGGFYVCFVWMAIFMSHLIPSEPYTPEEAFGMNSMTLFVSVCLLFPVAGILSDKFGRIKIMTVGGLICALGAPLLVVGIGEGNRMLTILCQSCLGLTVSLWGAPMTAWYVESFPPEARLTSAAVGYNIGQACIGGVAPALATFMVDRFGYLSPGFLVTFMASLSLFGLWVVAPPSPTTIRTQALEDLDGDKLTLRHLETVDTKESDSERQC
eukprot:scaffold1870_cov104-Cylindrotheca_fusiformis.AAC.3